ncbi:hypothetical protein RUM43_003398 [Polyplax serrata]|uniref:Uncharacterized protein n=1 Tax=Polyplax serrata TaxID=468196 RepID=A0AAN8P274_POLSC
MRIIRDNRKQKIEVVTGENKFVVNNEVRPDQSNMNQREEVEDDDSPQTSWSYMETKNSTGIKSKKSPKGRGSRPEQQDILKRVVHREKKAPQVVVLEYDPTAVTSG